MIYDVSGNVLTSVYSVNGSPLSVAYDIDGNVIFISDAKEIKVMTYNCGQWYIGSGSGITSEGTLATQHRALLNEIMTNQDPDILCIQEYWDVIGTTETKNLLSQYLPYYQEVQGHNTYYGHAIFSKYPISNFVTSPLSTPWDFKPVSESTNTGMSVERCTISIDSTDITVFNTHLATSSEESLKVSQAQAICSLVSQYQTFILCGDFNTVCKSVNDSEYITIMKQFVDAGFNVGNCSNQHGFTDTWTDGSTVSGEWYPCDIIVSSSNIPITDTYIDDTKITDGLNEKIDHVPFIAEMLIT